MRLQQFNPGGVSDNWHFTDKNFLQSLKEWIEARYCTKTIQSWAENIQNDFLQCVLKRLVRIQLWFSPNWLIHLPNHYAAVKIATAETDDSIDHKHNSLQHSRCLYLFFKKTRTKISTGCYLPINFSVFIKTRLLSSMTTHMSRLRRPWINNNTIHLWKIINCGKDITVIPYVLIETCSKTEHFLVSCKKKQQTAVNHLDVQKNWLKNATKNKQTSLTPDKMDQI